MINAHFSPKFFAKFKLSVFCLLSSSPQKNFNSPLTLDIQRAKTHSIGQSVHRQSYISSSFKLMQQSSFHKNRRYIIWLHIWIKFLLIVISDHDHFSFRVSLNKNQSENSGRREKFYFVFHMRKTFALLTRFLIEDRTNLIIFMLHMATFLRTVTQ